LPKPEVIHNRALICAKYADWRKATPNLKNLVPFVCDAEWAINAKFLGALDMEKKFSCGISLFADKKSNGKGPVVVLADGKPNFLGLIMPMRGSVQPSLAAAILKRPRRPKEPTAKKRSKAKRKKPR